MKRTLIKDNRYEGRTLIVDDMEEVYRKLQNKFKDSTYVGTVEKGLEEIALGNWDLVISDYDFGKDAPQGGEKIIRAAKAKRLDCILMSRDYHEKEAEKLGVRFIFKKKLLASKNINELIVDQDGRK